MKKFLLLLFVLFFTYSSYAQFLVPTHGSQYCSQKKIAIGRLPELTDNLTSGPTHSFDVLSYTMEVWLYHCYFSPYPKDFKATNIIKFKVDSTLNIIKLNAADSSLQIDSVRINGVSFTHTNDILTITLNRTYNPGEIAEVKVCYHHKNVPDVAFYTANGMVFTDCEPEGARYWFPCWDKPSDKATLDIKAHVPATAKLGSNGKLADSTITGDTCIYHWNSIHNIATYLMVMTSKVNYKLNIVYWHKLSNPSDSIPLRFYFNNGEDPTGIQNVLPDMCTYYSQNFIEHPFQKNGFASLNNLFPWGGMENQTLTSICPGCWDESLVAHEFSHQWFGDMVTCATWADVFLNEGFATWCEAFWRESYGGYAAYKADIDYYASTYLQQNAGWAISEPSWATVTPPTYILFDYSITYCKGACVLHQLRYVLGDSLYLAALQAYCSDTNLKFKSAVIPDLMAKVNMVTGQNYDWFFNEWIYQPNHPQYQNTYKFQDLGSGQWEVDFFMTQVQINAPFFKMPIQVYIRFSDNSDTTITVMNDANFQLFQWIFNKQPVFFQFDPDDLIVLKEDNTQLGIIEKHLPGEKFILLQNIPNPVTNSTKIIYEITIPMTVQLKILDMMGKTVLEKGKIYQQPGKYTTPIDCSALAPGIYYYRVTAGDQTQTRKMVVRR